MMLLILLALLLDRAAVVLKGVAGVQVLFFQRANLLVLVVDAQLVIATGLAKPGVAGLLGLQAGAGGLQGGIGSAGRRKQGGLGLVVELGGGKQVDD